MSPEAVVLGSAVAVPLSIVVIGIIGAKFLVRRGLARKAASGAEVKADLDVTLRRAFSRVQNTFGVEAPRLAKADAASAPSPLSAEALASISEALSETKGSDFLQTEAALQEALLSARAADELQLRDLERRLREFEIGVKVREAPVTQAKAEDQSAEEGGSRTQTRP